MRLSKSQLIVITILNVVIAVLVAVIFLMPLLSPPRGDSGKGPDGDTPNPSEHNKLREPTAGMVPEIVRETRLMGSGDESVVAVHFVDGAAYIFGNATVGDLDFDSYGGFLCTVGASGKIVGFTYFTGRITAVGIVEGGFAAATVSNKGTTDMKSRLYSVGYDGAAREVVTLDGEAADIIPITDSKKTAVVTKPTENSFLLTEYTVTESGEWVQKHNTRISSGYMLDYFDCFNIGDEYILAAHAYVSSRYDALALYTFQAGGSAAEHLYDGNGGRMTRPYAVAPYEEGYVALCRYDGVATLMTVGYTFMTFGYDMLGFEFEDARILDSNGLYYACFECETGTVVYELDKILNRHKVQAAEGISADCTVKSNGTLLAGAYNGQAKISDTTGNRALTLDMTDVTFYGGYRRNDGTTLFVLSASGGKALSKPSGGKDIYVITVNI
ncbi:MAG: hypothetical protein J1G01_00050 [Clostridiales bacterium]|nr:hypothetical protein [Clostridiales bacterium]